MSARHTVVITGCGAVSALGLTADALWDGLPWHGQECLCYWRGAGVWESARA